MKKVGVAILGLGIVGGGTYEILTKHREFYKKNHGVDIVVENALERNTERISSLGIDENIVASGIAEICSNPEVDIVVEAMGGIEPARSFVIAALNAGKSVVTSNKELYCKYSYELEKLAKKNHVGLYYEACCAGGVPVIRALLDNLQGNEISSFIGIINGTTNYILTKMTECGASYEQVLKEAQSLGFAEADSVSDVEGYDSAYKLSILASICFHTKVPFSEIYREGITSVSPEDVAYAKKLGYVIKLLAIGKNSEHGIEVRVHPAFIKADHPLASVNYSYNAVHVVGDSVGEVMLYGKGAGALPTGSAIVGDIIYCATHGNSSYSPFKNTENAEPSTKFVKNFESAYYLRLKADDKTGVLAKITSLLSKHSVSVAQIIQEKHDNGSAEIVIVTHMTREQNIIRATEDINNLSGIANIKAIIKVA